MTALTVCTLLKVLLAADMGDTGAPAPGVTSVPPVYVITYAADAPRDAAFLEAIRQAPPDILHLGHTVPLNSIFGPTGDYTGFNPKLVSADEILARRVELRQFVDDLHAAGVGKVICYINPSILGGDHEKRIGFWAFYDHWDDYAGLGIGPRPVRAPELWMQRERRSFAPWEPEPNYPHWRYEPCVNERAWVQYQQAVVRLIAACGYDGVFVDDCIMECRHDVCAQRFPEFVSRCYPAEAVSAAFPEGISLDPDTGPNPAHGETTLRTAATCLFWQESMADFLVAMNRAGQAVDPAFFMVPNWGATARVGGAASRIRNGKSVAAWRRASTYQMFEEDHPSGQFGSGGEVIGYLLQYNYGLALGVRPAILSYGTNQRQVEVGYAEAAAGGGGAYVQPGTAYPEIRGKWRTFYETHRDLYEGFTLAAPVGLVLSFDEPRFGNDEHLRQSYAAARALYREHVPFAAIPPENLVDDMLRRHKVIVAAEVQHLSGVQYGALEDFVRDGGRLLVTGRFAAFDLSAAPRTCPSLKTKHVDTAKEHLPRVSKDSGTAFHIDSVEEIVPAREFDIVRALDEREPAAFRMAIDKLGSQPQVERRDGPLVARWIEALAGGPVSLADNTPGVQTVMYERFSKEEATITVHAVRYAASALDDDACVAHTAPVNLTVPAPSGWRIANVEVVSPDFETTSITYDMHADSLRCELPQFEYYALLTARLRRD